jgi:hypothetical protein
MHAQLEALKATTETKEVTFKIAYGLPLDEMLRWGLFVSEPRNIRETDQPFPEPGALFSPTPHACMHACMPVLVVLPFALCNAAEGLLLLQKQKRSRLVLHHESS